ncbi:MAG: SOS response-associated peptidase [Bacteroidales bacterium]|nr:SOS response-associated peptidase [Bacteroidales bacterium]
MCGRFSLTKQEEAINQRFHTHGSHAPYVPRYNGAPSQNMAVITNHDSQHISHFKWGLVPSWSKDPQIGSRLINARAESIDQKASFKTSFIQRRCLVLSDGFFEWKKDRNKTAYYISLKDHKLFAMAGLWDVWADAEGKELNSFTIITTEPNSMMKSIHNRMPAILQIDQEEEWLQNNNRIDLKKILRPYPENEMQNWKVSPLVNSPINDSQEVIRRFIDPQVSLF